eukprot:gnl/Trimastix_PCT/747.p1 GENE.gnl/Trimastix_PCT/747~~gnl/Trimastix_PCT/747.p1  ORF type:complete len:231 (+),score=48.27 gnl/Trimastix_PCT/747:30-722(+)
MAERMQVVSEESRANLQERFEEYKKQIAEKAEIVIMQEFPAKLIELNQLCQEYHQYLVPNGETARILQETRQAILSRTEGAEIPLCQPICNIHIALKDMVISLMEAANSIKIWIELNIPRKEDGNNFGVSIQEETVSELGRVEEACQAFLDNTTKYYLSRGKILSKYLKYPTLEDYLQSVMELDEKELLNLPLCIIDLRNNYCVLRDVILKNLDRLKKPRSSSGMMPGMM